MREGEIIGAGRGRKRKNAGLLIRWGVSGVYVLDLVTNELLDIQGDRVRKALPWKAKEIEEARDLYEDSTGKRVGVFK